MIASFKVEPTRPAAAGTPHARQLTRIELLRAVGAWITLDAALHRASITLAGAARRAKLAKLQRDADRLFRELEELHDELRET